MNYLKILYNSLLKVIGVSFYSLFLGIPIFIYYSLEFIFESLGLGLNKQILVIISMVLIIVIATFIVSIIELFEQQKQKYKKMEEELKKRLISEQQQLINKDILRQNEWNAKNIYLEQYGKQISSNEERINQWEKDIIKIIEDRSQEYPWLAKLFADYAYMKDEKIAAKLKTKNHPAIKASLEVKDIAKEKRALQKQCKMYEYQMNYLETIFPWLEDFKELDPKEAFFIVNDTESNSEYDQIREWLSPEEYSRLPSDQKWQLALDRYTTKKKSNWQIGIDYERYIGYIYENNGYGVKYQGALKGLEDLGRDLIATNKNDIIVIQCKRWSANKIIHEKHIFQLYGTVILLKIQNPNNEVKGAFYTTTTLSETAKSCANFLNIQVFENYKLQRYPLIKCKNTSGDKIYHLPFDQQYDRVQINRKNGDCFFDTVKEAESHGFRHAYRWRGSDIANNSG